MSEKDENDQAILDEFEHRTPSKKLLPVPPGFRCDDGGLENLSTHMVASSKREAPEFSNQPHFTKERKGLINHSPVETPPSLGISTGNSPSFLPSFPSRRETSKLVSTRNYRYENLKTTSIQVPVEMWGDFMVELGNRGLRRKAGYIISCMIAQFLGTKILLHGELFNYTSFKQSVKEREVRRLLTELKKAKERRARDWFIAECEEKLERATRSIKLPAELEQQVRKELNL